MTERTTITPADLEIGESYEVVIDTTPQVFGCRAVMRPCACCDLYEHEIIRVSARVEKVTPETTYLCAEGEQLSGVSYLNYELEIPTAEVAERVVRKSSDELDEQLVDRLTEMVEGLDPATKNFDNVSSRVPDESRLHGSTVVMLGSCFDDGSGEADLLLLERVAWIEEAETFGWPILGDPSMLRITPRVGALVRPLSGRHRGRRCFVATPSDLIVPGRMEYSMIETNLYMDRQQSERDARVNTACDEAYRRYGLDDLVPSESISILHSNWNGIRDYSYPALHLSMSELAAFAIAVIENPEAADLLLREATADIFAGRAEPPFHRRRR